SSDGHTKVKYRGPGELVISAPDGATTWTGVGDHAFEVPAGTFDHGDAIETARAVAKHLIGLLALAHGPALVLGADLGTHRGFVRVDTTVEGWLDVYSNSLHHDAVKVEHRFVVADWKLPVVIEADYHGV